ncbi:MAG: agmatine deiminase family protein, partial [Pseudomonadota bacterium]
MINPNRFWRLAAAAACVVGIAANAGAREDDLSFPPEWAPHEAVWMGWTDTIARREELQALWAQVLRALTPHVTVKLLAASPDVAEQARNALAPRGVDFTNIRFVIQPTTDMWLRDSGPLFITDGKRKAIADFRWAFYGAPSPYADPGRFARGQLDAQAAVGLGIARRRSPVVAEGGGLDVNSATLIAYKDAAMHRNPSVPLEQL